MNRKHLYKDLEKWKQTKKKQSKKYYDTHSRNATNSKKQYTPEEIELIIKHEISDVELSKILGRSVNAIQVKRSKLNKDNEIKAAIK